MRVSDRYRVNFIGEDDKNYYLFVCAGSYQEVEQMISKASADDKLVTKIKKINMISRDSEKDTLVMQ